MEGEGGGKDTDFVTFLILTCMKMASCQNKPFSDFFTNILCDKSLQMCLMVSL